MSKQLEFFEGYRPLITHNRKRNTITSEVLKDAQHWPAQEKKQHERPPAHYVPMPSSTRESVFAGCDRTAFNAKVKALIECYKPIEARMKESHRKWKLY